MGMNNWIQFNDIMINKNNVIFVKKLSNSLIIEIGTTYYSFNKLFENNNELEAEYNRLIKELKIS